MVVECQADLDVAKTNLEFTVIKSPVDGVVIDRKIDPGQTVASQFQTPVLFVVAPDLEKKIYVYASVDEADIGMIRDAQRNNQPVAFAVDAYPNDAFEGRIAQVRLNPTTVQNVVTYTVVVESPNHELKLLPGMTANLTFQIENRHGVLVVPNGALRFWPKAEQVRAEDQSLVESEPVDDSSDEEAEPKKSKAAGGATGNRNHHYVWTVDGEQLAAVEIVTGLSDKSGAELVSGKLGEGQELVVATQTKPTRKSIFSRPRSRKPQSEL